MGFYCILLNNLDSNFYGLTFISAPLKKELSLSSLVIIVVCIVVTVFVVVMVFVLQYMCKYKRKLRNANTADCDKHKSSHRLSVDLETLSLNELVGRGKYGAVWKATLDGNIRAVKVFLPEHRMYWVTEKEAYMAGITHPNILKVGVKTWQLSVIDGAMDVF